MSDALLSLLTALGDDELVLGHRHSEWTGYAPHIEEDVAFSSIAQDEIGHAAALYSIVAEVTGDNPDNIALGRKPEDYRNATLCEKENREWAFTLARHWLYDMADAVRLEALEETNHDKLGALVRKMRREERYHLIHADIWMKRVGSGPVEGRSRLVDAMTEVFPHAVGLFEPFELEAEAVKEGWLPVSSDELRHRFLERTGSALDEMGLPSHGEERSHTGERAEFVASSSGDLIAGEEDGNGTAPASAGLGGRRGKHSSEFDSLWDVMTKTYRENPGATW